MNKNKESAVILRGAVPVRISKASVEPVVNNGAKTKSRHALKRSLRGFRFAQPLKMTFLSLAAVLSLGIINESWAGKICDCGTTGHETECCWEFDGTTLTVFANTDANGEPYTNVSVKDGEYWQGGAFWANETWRNLGAQHLIVGNGINTIGIGSFGIPSLTSVDMPNVRELKSYAFCNTDLTSVDIPSATVIEDYAFYYSDKLQYVGLSENINLSNNWAFGGSNISNDCGKGGSCGSCDSGQYVMPGRGCVSECENGYTANTETKQCVRDSAPADSSTPSADTQPTAASCANDGKVLKGNACVSSCGSSFRLNDGECDRIRYTPAEAAQYLKDTDNTIIMTFKVNR